MAEGLNGESYQTSADIGGVPILERTSAQMKIAGQVSCKTGLLGAKLNHVKVKLVAGPRNLASTFTDSDGAYAFLSTLDPSYPMQLTVSSKYGDETFQINPKASEKFYLRDLRIRCD